MAVDQDGAAITYEKGGGAFHTWGLGCGSTLDSVRGK